MSDASAAYQAAFAAAIRQGGAQGFDEKRLAVYVRLIRNNINGFLDRCYVETPEYLGEETWQALKEDFVAHGQAHSPYFQEIAGEFLAFCRQKPLSDGVLDLMDFEYAQLLAEVAQMPSENRIETAAATPHTLAAAALLRDYAYAVTDALQPQPTPVLIWRNFEDEVLFLELDGFDRLLLHTVSESPLALAKLETMLAEWMPSENGWRQGLAERWRYWQEQGVLVAAE
ncbi:putative DNA-binding domain-containing protein [Neisseria sp. ZJ106]|uniref:DNA-binding domain-containing protein n=1 Tax=Neisseria lisongii TaxID=2912188 RepID=A0ABY7RI53_9NEIS|nr:putative DNA-binding domain-containing protein [Neisseria lisongii]MCF7520913.1 putative DNA-binding domain-containing protein [Neisseria lisongii]WCL71280.1 putative DNA-binding domain-containing protein [Neisseria lisongii]